nr:Os12g0155250 [Ipomoea batatas]
MVVAANDHCVTTSDCPKTQNQPQLLECALLLLRSFDWTLLLTVMAFLPSAPSLVSSQGLEILQRCSICTTSAIRFITQSNKAASVGGRLLTSRTHSSSDCARITSSGDRESSTPFGSSLNHAYKNISSSFFNCK